MQEPHVTPNSSTTPLTSILERRAKQDLRLRSEPGGAGGPKERSDDAPPNSMRRAKQDLRLRSERGMTLIEIMVVIAIIGLVMGGVGVVAFQKWKDAQLKEAKIELHNLKNAVQHWAIDNSGEPCPKTLQELVSGKYINKSPKDPWGQEYVYVCPGQGDDGYEIASKGPDRKAGTEDDIKSAGL